MDWGNVTVDDLFDALREVDWSSPPRPPSEFFSRFTVPKSVPKWDSRLKCNLYYYRTNYFIMIVVILGLGVLTRPLAIFAALLTALSLAFLNDSFAGSFSEKATRTVIRFSPQLAAKMRPPLTPVTRGRPSSKRAIHVCGQPRWVFVLTCSLVSFALWYISSGLLRVSVALLIAHLATILHASLRTPNLKARFNTFREEFRAVWRNYSEI
nr:unknown [Arabidopsis thaliana]